MIAAVFVAAAQLTRPSKSGAPAGPRAGGHVVGKSDAQYYENSRKLVFGMSKRQVRRLVGPPSRTVGRCWQYDINVDYPANKNRGEVIWNAQRVCFDGGRYAESHGKYNGKWDYETPLPTFVGSS